jgi:hypothetical protein
MSKLYHLRLCLSRLALPFVCFSAPPGTLDQWLFIFKAKTLGGWSLPFLKAKI